jgi:hypothetical protein
MKREKKAKKEKLCFIEKKSKNIKVKKKIEKAFLMIFNN